MGRAPRAKQERGSGINLNPDAVKLLTTLSFNLDKMVKGQAQLAVKLNGLEIKLDQLYKIIDEDLGPLLDDTTEMLERFDAMSNVIVDGAKSENLTLRAKATMAIEKIQEVFEIIGIGGDGAPEEDEEEDDAG
jgi:hypothetical protein